jgi:hypothetical protein
VRKSHLFSGIITDTNSPDLACFDRISHEIHELGNRHLPVWVMDLIQIDVAASQAREAGFKRLWIVFDPES